MDEITLTPEELDFLTDALAGEIERRQAYIRRIDSYYARQSRRHGRVGRSVEHDFEIKMREREIEQVEALQEKIQAAIERHRSRPIATLKAER